MSDLALRWVDSDPGGTGRSALLNLISQLPIELRTEHETSVDDDALIVIDPPKAENDVSFVRLVREFQSTDRPTAALRPTSQTAPADLLIVVFDGLLAQLSETADSTPFDDVLLALLRREWMTEPRRYEVWYQRALLNAAIAQLFDAKTKRAVSLLLTARELGAPPSELSPSDCESIVDALLEGTSESTEERQELRKLQDWLLS